MKDIDQWCLNNSPRIQAEDIETEKDEGMNRVVHCIQQYDSNQKTDVGVSPREGEIDVSTQDWCFVKKDI